LKDLRKARKWILGTIQDVESLVGDFKDGIGDAPSEVQQNWKALTHYQDHKLKPLLMKMKLESKAIKSLTNRSNVDDKSRQTVTWLLATGLMGLMVFPGLFLISLLFASFLAYLATIATMIAYK
jgi:hypothetical protein